MAIDEDKLVREFAERVTETRRRSAGALSTAQVLDLVGYLSVGLGVTVRHLRNELADQDKRIADLESKLRAADAIINDLHAALSALRQEREHWLRSTGNTEHDA